VRMFMHDGTAHVGARVDPEVTREVSSVRERFIKA
jgi:hypothetical protein